jgi:hypothetical protein
LYSTDSIVFYCVASFSENLAFCCLPQSCQVGLQANVSYKSFLVFPPKAENIISSNMFSSSPWPWAFLIMTVYIDLICFREKCSMPDIWDVEDNKNRGRPSCCSLLFRKVEEGSHVKPFQLAFRNNDYTVLRT